MTNLTYKIEPFAVGGFISSHRKTVSVNGNKIGCFTQITENYWNFGSLAARCDRRFRKVSDGVKWLLETNYSQAEMELLNENI